MKRFKSVLNLIFLVLISCEPDSPKQNKREDKKEIQVAEIQGCWTTYGLNSGTSCNGLASEQSMAPYTEIENWYIGKDSIWVLRYPCQLYEMWSYKLIGDSLFINNELTARSYVKADSAELHFVHTSCRTENFVRDTFDLKMIRTLIRDSVNPECLVGRMKLVTHYDPWDEASFDESFPVPMPQYINIKSKESALDLYKKKTITILIEGKPRLFHVRYMQWDNLYQGYPVKNDSVWQNRHNIMIVPGEWWKGEEFTVGYVEEK